MVFKVNAMEVINRRYKSNYPCNQDWQIHDSNVQMRHSQVIGCRTPYQTQDTKLRPCSTRYEMRMARFALRYDEYGYAPPCKSMERISYS